MTPLVVPSGKPVSNDEALLRIEDKLDTILHRLDYARLEELHGTRAQALKLELLTLLTMRQREIVEWALQGKNGGEIAIILGLKRKTVYNHLRDIYRRMEVDNSRQLVARFSLAESERL